MSALAARSERISASDDVFVEALFWFRPPLLLVRPPPPPPPSSPSFFGGFCFLVEELCCAVGASAELLMLLFFQDRRLSFFPFSFVFVSATNGRVAFARVSSSVLLFSTEQH